MDDPSKGKSVKKQSAKNVPGKVMKTGKFKKNNRFGRMSLFSTPLFSREKQYIENSFSVLPTISNTSLAITAKDHPEVLKEDLAAMTFSQKLLSLKNSDNGSLEKQITKSARILVEQPAPKTENCEEIYKIIDELFEGLEKEIDALYEEKFKQLTKERDIILSQTTRFTAMMTEFENTFKTYLDTN